MNKKTAVFSVHKLLALAALIAIYIFFCIFGNNFLSRDAFVNILDSSYYIGFMAIGVTFVIITGGIDLSVGTVMMCAALIGGVSYTVWNFSIAAALLLSVAVGTIFGLLNGLVITKLGVVPFVATLGMQMVASGFGAIVSKVTTMRYPTVGQPDAWFKYAFFKTTNGFPIGVVWLAIFFFLAYIVLNKTRIGRYTFAIGSNEEAARLSGIKTKNWKVIVYTISGFFSGLAAVMFSSAYTSITPATGAGNETLAIAGVVVGGTSLAGGVGTVTGTLIGVGIMSVLKQGLMSMNLQGHWQTFLMGIVVILAVWMDAYRNKRADIVRKKAAN